MLVGFARPHNILHWVLNLPSYNYRFDGLSTMSCCWQNSYPLWTGIKKLMMPILFCLHQHWSSCFTMFSRALICLYWYWWTWNAILHFQELFLTDAIRLANALSVKSGLNVHVSTLAQCTSDFVLALYLSIMGELPPGSYFLQFSLVFLLIL